jgi:cyanophycin synthetase
MSRASVPAAEQIVFLRATGNLSTGGTSIDVTDIVHPDNIEMAVRAARAIGLDVAGSDFLSTAISESYSATRGAICEVNAAPAFACTSRPARANRAMSPVQ